MTDVAITKARSDRDLDAVRALCWAYHDFLLNNSPIDRDITQTFYPVPKYSALMDKLPDLHARPSGIILLARDAQGQPIGCGMTHALDKQTSEIKRVFVSPEGRGTGVASEICKQLISQARADGFKRIVLDTSCQLHGAQALYARLGFSRRGPYQDVPAEILPVLVFYEMML